MGEVEARRRAAWRFVRAVVRSQAGGVVGAVLSGLLWQTGPIPPPLIVSYTIDHGIVPRDRHTLLVWLLALLGVGLLEVVAGGMRHIYAIRNRSATDARVRDAIFAHALRLDPSYHDRVGPGELMSRASSDSEHVARMMDAIGHTIGYALTVVAVSIVMLVVDAKLALLVLLPLPFVSVVAWLYSRRYDERTRRLQEAWASAATLVEESVSGIRRGSTSRSEARCSWRTCGSATRATARSSMGSISSCARASRSRSSAQQAPARARSPASSRGSTTRTAAASSSTAMTYVGSGSLTCGRRSRSSSRRPSSSRRACA